MKTGHPIVDDITTMKFLGIIIDHRWIGHEWLCRKTEKRGLKFDRDAAYVLAEICYFYSAKIERDPDGHITTVEKRFDGETMYQDYETWAAKLGCTKRELQDIIAFLKAQGLIESWAEPVILRNGVKTNNMPHIRPVPSKIREMTFGGGVPKKRDAPPEVETDAEISGQPNENGNGASPESVRGLTEKRETSTVRHTEHFSEQQTSQENEAQSLANCDGDVVVLISSNKPATAGHVLGEINTNDEKLAKRNGKSTKRDSRQNAAEAGQPLLSGAALSSTPAPKPPADADLLRRVQQIKVTGKVAAQLIAQHREETERQLEYWPYQKNIDNPGAWFAGAVRGAYDAPPEYIKAQEAKAREIAHEAERREQQQRDEQEREKRRTVDAESTRLDAEFEALSESEKAAFDAEIHRRNPDLGTFLKTLGRGATDSALATHRRQLLREDWQPKEEATRRLDKDAPADTLDAAFEALPAVQIAEVEKGITAYFAKLGAEAVRDSKTWLTVRRTVMREMVQQGVLKLQAQAA